MKVDSTNKKFNFINSSKKDINNDNSIEPDKDIKHNYKYNDKTYHGKIKFADNVEKKKDGILKNPENKDVPSKNSGKKIIFVNSRLENSENNLKDLDSTGDLFLDKLQKLENDSSKNLEKRVKKKKNIVKMIKKIKKKITMILLEEKNIRRKHIVAKNTTDLEGNIIKEDIVGIIRVE